MDNALADPEAAGGEAPAGGLALFTDLYELTMLQAYVEEDMTAEAVFSLFVRRLPPKRNFLLACGLDTVLGYLEGLAFDESDIAYLRSLGQFSEPFLTWLRDFRFTGDVHAVAEGTPVFANEPILEVVAPLPQAQLIETFVMNQINIETVLASKAARVVAAAQGRAVVDFGARRMHGIDAAVKGARAFYVGGVAATSNMLAGRRYGIPVAGTMAHSYIQAHESEEAAFRDFTRLYPETTLLVDTYDTLAGVDRVIALARELGSAFRVKAIRLDSGDLAGLAREARRRLDAGGLQRVEIVVSGGLDEYRIATMLAAGAPIDGFGVGTAMGVSDDAPDIDIAYKLCEYAGGGRIKLSTGKPILPGRKQVFRSADGACDVGDVIARDGEELPGRPLLTTVMTDGRRTESGSASLAGARAHAQEQLARLPAPVRALEKAEPPYPVGVSAELSAYQEEVRREIAASRESGHD